VKALRCWIWAALALPLLVLDGPLGPSVVRAFALQRGAAPSANADLERARRRCAELADPARANEAFTELASLGPIAAEAALEGFASAGLAARRARSLLVREVGRGGQVQAVLGLLSDSDAEVRSNLLSFLARPELRDALAQPRAEALERVARSDPLDELRAKAIDALGRIEEPAAAAALERLMDDLAPPLRTAAARSLANLPAARERVVERVQAAFEPRTGVEPLPEDALAELFGPAYGLRLAEIPAGGTRPRDLAPFVLGAHHPSTGVRRSAELALERFVGRTRYLGEQERGERLLSDLVGRGLDDADLLARRARLALEAGADAESARSSARALGVLSESGDDVRGLQRRGLAGLLEAAASLALDQPAEASAALDAAERATQALVERRLDRLAPNLALVQVEMLERRAQIELYRALAQLWSAPDPSQAGVLAAARRAHVFSLQAQIAVTREWLRISPDGSRPPPWGLDTLIDDPLSPWRLLLSNPELAALPAERSLELERQLLVALASVAPLEVPGFGASREGVRDVEPAQGEAGEAELVRTDDEYGGEQGDTASSVDPSLHDPRKDPERVSLLIQLVDTYVEALNRLAAGAGPSQQDEDPGARQERLKLFRLEARQLEGQAQQDQGNSWNAHLRRRVPTDAALRLCEGLRAEGRTEASRALAQHLIDDLRGAGEVLRAAWGEELMARGEVAIAAAWMDDDEPKKAESLYLSALQRLEVLERESTERGVAPAGLAVLQVQRADVLLGLAVNANVKLRSHETAVEYFERAWALRQDDFMRVLLACYRARAGRHAEARAVLRDVPVSPSNFYNLACTYALLGERELALDFLGRALDELKATPGQLERQKTWARGDPDLETLRGEARFEALVAASPAAEPR
jgi:tetratricopeptide (TPR) repeat protein